MCAVSAVSDYYTRKDRWPANPFDTHAPTVPLPYPVPTADQETKEMMRQVLKLLDKIDKKLGDVECMDDEKATFLKALDLNPTDLGG